MIDVKFFKYFVLLLVGVVVSVASHGQVTAENAPTHFKKTDKLSDVLKHAYDLYDLQGLKAIEAHNKANPGAALEPWKGNLSHAIGKEKPADSEFPWRDKELDLSVKSDAKKFSGIVLNYILEGWFNKVNKDNFDSHFRTNSKRTWCSSPWVSDGPNGRSAVHGLLRELPLRPNPVFGAQKGFAPFGEKLAKDDRPLGWGVPFFNKPVCDIYGEVFGTKSKPQFPPQYNKYKTPNGFVSFKLHFNTMSDWQKYKPFEGAYYWTDFVAQKKKSVNYREMRTLPLIQIAVSFKDDHYTLNGIRRDVDYWVMLVFTYDKDYINTDIAHLDHIPEPLKHMKPMGIQTGLEPEHTILFDGSVTNYMEIDEKGQEKFIPSGHQALLNGASDNAQSSCMGCHANDFGRKSAMNQKLLGKPNDKHGDFTWKWTFYDAKSYQNVKAKVGPVTEFNLHLESAEKRSSRFLVRYCQENVPSKICTSKEYERAKSFVSLLCTPGYDLEGLDYCE